MYDRASSSSRSLPHPESNWENGSQEMGSIWGTDGLGKMKNQYQHENAKGKKYSHPRNDGQRMSRWIIIMDAVKDTKEST
jgi:hypothetical protein